MRPSKEPEGAQVHGIRSWVLKEVVDEVAKLLSSYLKGHGSLVKLPLTGKGETLKAVVNRSVSKWKPVTNGISQGLVMGLMLNNSFVGNVNSGIKCTVCRLADKTKLNDAVAILEGRDAIQWDLDRLER